MKVFNVNGDEWDRQEDREGWRSKDAWVGYHIGAELLGGSMYELEAGDKLWPYHTHHANEEWVVVLRGTPTLRTHDSEEVLKEGDVFPDIHADSREGDVALSERWRNGPLVVAFMRHFG